VLGATIKETRVIITTTTTNWKQFALIMLFFSKSCPFSADIIGLRVLTWNSRHRFVSCQSLPPSPPGLPLRRIQFVLILVFSNGALSHSDFILKFIYDNSVMMN
jgi:hypothetical protein